MKTLIELFDECQIENVVAGIRFLPEKIVFVGFKEVMKKKKIRDLENFFQMRGKVPTLEFVEVDRYQYDDICEKLHTIIDQNEDCCFDLTGGKELVLAAMGDVSSQRNLPMFQFNVRSGTFIRIARCENLEEPERVALSIAEIITLNGGILLTEEAEDFSWTLEDDFCHDVQHLWNLCKQNCGLWNRQCMVFSGLETFGEYDSQTLQVCANLKELKEQHRDIYLNRHLLNELCSRRMLLDYHQTEDTVSFQYKNEQIHQILTKSGNILELISYLAVRTISWEDPGYYDDMDIGVHVDWDGLLRKGTPGEKKIKNEIDIILMRDLVPVFISCKNGEVEKEDLYELSAVANRFGGEYAKKIMLATYVSTSAESKKYLIQRAEDMGIDLIADLHLLDAKKFEQTLRKRVK